MAGDQFVLAIDIGGTKLAAARVDSNGGVHRRRQVPTQPAAAGQGEALWSTLLAMVEGQVVREIVAGDADVAETVRVLAELWWRAVYSRPDA